MNRQYSKKLEYKTYWEMEKELEGDEDAEYFYKMVGIDHTCVMKIILSRKYDNSKSEMK